LTEDILKFFSKENLSKIKEQISQTLDLAKIGD